MRGSYHHGNLKNALIERGLSYISREGMENFSFRKLSEICDVSMAAPYSHFKSKGDFLDAAEEYVTQALLKNLSSSIQRCTDAEELIIEAGTSYILFSYNNPLYRQLLNRHESLMIQTYPPFLVFKDALYDKITIGDVDASKDKYDEKAIAYWALIEGLSSMSLGDNESRLSEDEIRHILQSVVYRPS